MSDVMQGMRGRTVARFGKARFGASRFGYAPSDVKESDTSLYAWEQQSGPVTLEDTDPDTAWTDLVRP